MKPFPIKKKKIKMKHRRNTDTDRQIRTLPIKNRKIKH